jgi:hypothetical protein
MMDGRILRKNGGKKTCLKWLPKSVVKILSTGKLFPQGINERPSSKMIVIEAAR